MESVRLHNLDHINPFDDPSRNSIDSNSNHNINHINDNIDDNDDDSLNESNNTKFNKKVPFYRKKIFISGTIIASSIMLIILLTTLFTKSHHKLNNLSSNSSLSPDYHKVNNNIVPKQNKEDIDGNSIDTDNDNDNDNNNNNNSTNWRLDTANNYTSNLEYWRNDYNTTKDRHYYFNITSLLKIDANGAIRNLTVINDQYPGPLIEANSGDTIYLHVLNKMDDEPVSFHLHGLFYPNNSFDDGASSINVCPIAPGLNYTYKIPIGEKEFGTYWYHSHWGTQYADGVYGPLIIHSPIEDSNLTNYDADRVYVANDYYYQDADQLLSTYLIPDNENSEPTPDAGLISGTYSQSTNYFTPIDENNKFKTSTYFDPNLNYRIRIVNVGFFLPFKFSIDEHKLSLIEVDGTLIEPLISDYVDVSVGERYSFFMNRTNHDLDSFWIHARFNQFCLATNNPDFSTDVLAIISYNNEYSIPKSKETWSYDGGSPKCLDFPQDQLRTLNNQVPINKNGSNRPDEFVELDVSFMEGGNQMSFAYFNDYSWRALSNTSTMHELLFNENFNKTSHIENSQTFNENQYILNFDKRDMIVDFLINNFDDGAHPFHLHGYKFWVLANSKTGSFYPNFYEKHPERLDLTNPILRDTVSVPPFGFAVLRIVIDNPGVFPFHCHIGWHMEAGLMLQVNALQSEWSKFDYQPKWAEMCGYDFSDKYLTELID